MITWVRTLVSSLWINTMIKNPKKSLSFYQNKYRQWAKRKKNLLI